VLAKRKIELDVEPNGNWYDFTVNSGCLNYTRRYMGRMETGFDSISDPAMAF